MNLELESKINQIVAKASSLFDRLYGEYLEPDPIQNQAQISDRLQQLQQVVAPDQPEKLSLLLNWYGLEQESLRPWLGSVHVVSGKPLPEWVETLEAIINCNKQISDSQKQGLIDPENPILFEEVLIPLVILAREKIQIPSDILSTEADFNLQKGLLKELSSISVSTLYYEFKKILPTEKLANKTNNRIYYQSFVDQLLTKEGWLSFLEEYAGLAKLLSIRIEFWIKTTSDFLTRLQHDWDEIINEFSINLTDQVTEIKSGLSDSHNSGYSVMILTFKFGCKLVYKPKNINLELAYYDFLAWLNQQDLTLEFKIIKFLNRHHYGWVEYISQEPCQDQLSVSRFYQRAGMTLAVLYGLKSSDYHRENCIANGEHLVLIDMETILPIQVKWFQQEPQSKIASFLSNSVIRTAMLPVWRETFKGVFFELSALGCIESKIFPRKLPKFKAINTDNIHVTLEEEIIETLANVPTLNNSKVFPEDYLQEFITGFEQMYNFLLDKRSDILENNPYFNNLLSQTIRLINRATQVYMTILQKNLSYNLLHEGIDRSIQLQVLTRVLLKNDDKTLIWDAVMAEITAIEQLDIPYFTAEADSDNLNIDENKKIKEYLGKSSRNLVIQNLLNLNSADLKQQVKWIKGSFASRVVRLESGDQVEQNFSDNSLLNSSQLIEEANLIAQEIIKESIIIEDEYYWLSLNQIGETDLFQTKILDQSLESGNTGIALFLASLAYVTNNSDYYAIAQGALKPLQKYIATPQSTEQLTKSMGIGGLVGIGSIIYSLVKISQVFPQQKSLLLDSATKLTKAITPKAIASDNSYNIMSGTAGTLLSLLALYQQTNSETILNQAIACGEHLLQHQAQINRKLNLFTTSLIDSNKEPIIGFAQGIAGISYALLKLYQVTKTDTYLTRALQIIAQENSLLPQVKQVYSWSQGLTGIVLARLANISHLDREYQELQKHLNNIETYGLGTLDNLYSGNLGRGELLIVAHQKLQENHCLDLAYRQASACIIKAKNVGNYQLFSNLPIPLVIPSFIYGTSGIGYQLLRLVYPDLLPSLLLWE